MKNIYKFFAVAAAVSTLASCELSEYNPNEYGEAMAFGSESAIQMALNNFYIDFPSLSSAYSGEFGKADYTMATSLANRFTVAYSPDQELTWDGWTDLRSINYFLQMMNSDACGVSGALKDNFVAQGRFFRARWYFSMLKRYGDLPWYDHMITEATADEYNERDSRDLIIKKINEDLDYAIEKITATSVDATTVTKYVAAFYKMSANLYEASFRKYNNVTASVTGQAFSNYTVEDLYKECIKAAEVIMNSGEYSLVSDFRSLFTSKALLKEEVILGAATSNTVLGSQNTYYNYQNQKSLVRPFINTFLMKDGSAYTNKSSYATDGFVAEFADRDPRLAMTVRTPGYKYNGAKVVPSISDLSAPLGYQIIKFCLDKSPDGANDQKGNSNNNSVPVFRYAEVLLDYAEAKAELGQLSADDWTKTVGAIRKRAGITGGTNALPTVLDQYLKTTFYPDVTDPIIMEIRRERGCELCLEGQRMNDLLRWGRGELLAKLSWTGLNIPGMNVPVDIDEDGTADYYFTEGTAPSEYQSIAVRVNDQSGLQVISNGSVKQLEYSVAAANRYWPADGHYCLEAIPALCISTYRDHGHTLTQNPGY